VDLLEAVAAVVVAAAGNPLSRPLVHRSFLICGMSDAGTLSNLKYSILAFFMKY